MGAGLTIFPLVMLFVAAVAAFRGDGWIAGAFACVAALAWWIGARSRRGG